VRDPFIGGKVKSLGAFFESEDEVLVCTHATFRFAVDEYGVGAFDDRLIAVDEFHHVSANPDNRLGLHLGQFIALATNTKSFSSLAGLKNGASDLNCPAPHRD
jgi:hypothetical protein